MDIFEVEGNVVVPTIHARLLSPFREVWDRDKSEKKQQAILEFKFIEFTCSMRKSNPYSGFEEDIRAKKVAEKIFPDIEFEPDEQLLKCIEEYKMFRDEASPTVRFYEAALTGAEKLANFFIDVDFTKTNDKGVPLYKPGEIARALKDAPDILSSLNKMKEKVDQEIFDQVKTRSGKEINPLER